MNSFRTFLGEAYRLDSNGLPPEPGTTPVPRGLVRGYHFTDNLKSVLQHGLDSAYARGNTYGEPNVIWMSTVMPRNFKEFVEVHLSPKEILMNGPDLYPKVYPRGGEPREKTQSELDTEVADYNRGDHDFYLNLKRVPPERFVTYFEPWMYHFRYFVKEYPLTSKDSIKRGLDAIGDVSFLHPGTPERQALDHWMALAKTRGLL